MTARVATLLAGAAAAIAIAAGCGGGDSSGASAVAQVVTKAEFIKHAGEVCREERADVKERTDRYLAFHKNEPAEKKLYNYVHLVLLPTIEAETTRVRHIPHPPQDETEISAMLSATELATEKVATRKRIPSLMAVYASFGESEAQFRALGLTACANGPHFQRYNSVY